jgi:hypothetical protein
VAVFSIIKDPEILRYDDLRDPDLLLLVRH